MYFDLQASELNVDLNSRHTRQAEPGPRGKPIQENYLLCLYS